MHDRAKVGIQVGIMPPPLCKIRLPADLPLSLSVFSRARALFCPLGPVAAVAAF